jgi:predicted  nucleic acid-binding Zn-ribbon protein
MSSDPPELGKGLFGYRKSAVNQIIADRDIMLRQAEGRVRSAESKVAELESELVSMRDRNTRMDEQLERLRQQLDALAARGGAVFEEPLETPTQPEPAAEVWDEHPAATAEPAYQAYAEEFPGEPEHRWPGTETDWPAEAEGPAVDFESAPPRPDVTAQDEELPYGAEIRLGEDAAADMPAQTWVQAESAAQAEEDQDEVAMAPGSYGFEDFAAEEEQSYGEFGETQEEAEEEPELDSPAPFNRFPFTTEVFDQGPASMPGDEVERYEGEPIPEVGAFEAPSQQPEPAQQSDAIEQPQPAAPAPPPGVSQETADITHRFLTEELAGILAAAEESAARIVERARATTQRQIARSNRVWREVQAEVSRFGTWRQEVEPVIRNVQNKVEGVRSEIEEVPERIRQALAPMADAISAIDADLAELAAASNPPLLLTPGGLESEGSDSEAWGADPDEDDSLEDRDPKSGGSSSDPFGIDSEDPYGRSFGDSEGNEGPGHLHAG